MDPPLLIRRQALAQALANLRARGVEPSAGVVALYTRYARGELSHDQVRQVMEARAKTILPCQSASRLARREASYAELSADRGVHTYCNCNRKPG